MKCINYTPTCWSIFTQNLHLSNILLLIIYKKKSLCPPFFSSFFLRTFTKSQQIHPTLSTDSVTFIPLSEILHDTTAALTMVDASPK